MVDLLPDLGIAKDAMGLAITAGYIAYAVGMSINSLLTDRRREARQPVAYTQIRG